MNCELDVDHPEKVEDAIWAWVTTVRGAHQHWRTVLDRARTGEPVLIVDQRNDVGTVGLVPWHMIVLLDRINLLPAKTTRLPLSTEDAERMRAAYRTLYNDDSACEGGCTAIEQEEAGSMTSAADEKEPV